MKQSQIAKSLGVREGGKEGQDSFKKLSIEGETLFKEKAADGFILSYRNLACLFALALLEECLGNRKSYFVIHCTWQMS